MTVASSQMNHCEWARFILVLLGTGFCHGYGFLYYRHSFQDTIWGAGFALVTWLRFASDRRSTSGVTFISSFSHLKLFYLVTPFQALRSSGIIMTSGDTVSSVDRDGGPYFIPVWSDNLHPFFFRSFRLPFFFALLLIRASDTFVLHLSFLHSSIALWFSSLSNGTWQCILIMSSFLATLLQSTFPLDGPINTDGDYTGTSRPFSSSTGFSMDEEENIRRGGAVGHPLAQPVSIPATNGLRYNTQQPAMQEVP